MPRVAYRSVGTTFRADDPTYRRLREVGEELNLGTGKVVRRLIDRYLEQWRLHVIQERAGVGQGPRGLQPRV